VICIEPVKVGDCTCLGLRVNLPDSPPLLLIVAKCGFVMCGFLDVGAAEKLGVVAAVVRGVKTFQHVLDGRVVAATAKAKALGVSEEMKGAEALKQMM